MKMELYSSMRNAVRKGAVYNVYAAEDIVTAGGKTVYKKGAEVAKNLITGENGSVNGKESSAWKL